MKITQTKAIDLEALRSRMKELGVTIEEVRKETVRRKIKKGETGYSYHKIRRTLSIRDQVQMKIVKVAMDLVEKAEAEQEAAEIEMLKQAQELQLTEA